MITRQWKAGANSLKAEAAHGVRFSTRAEAKPHVSEYIGVYYNRKRLHSKLGYVSPEAFEAASDWRMPSKDELIGISPSLYNYYPDGYYYGWFWSSSPNANYSGGAWIVDFYLGNGYYGYKDDGSGVRLVREGQWVFCFEAVINGFKFNMARCLKFPQAGR